MRTVAPHTLCRIANLAALAALVWAPRPAEANIAASRPDPAVVGGPALVTTQALRIEDERLTFRCVEQSRRPICDFRAVYRVRGAADLPQRVVGAFYGVHAEGVRVTLSGRAVQRALSGEESARLDAAVRAAVDNKGQVASLVSSTSTSRTGFAATFEPRRTVELVASGRVRPGAFFRPTYATTPVRTRHLLLGTRPAEPDHDLQYIVAPLRTWGGAPTVRVEVRYPLSWEVGLSLLGQVQTARQRREREVGEERVLSFELPGRGVELLQLHITLPPRRFYNGGLLLGLGGRVNGASGFRARLGYEIATLDWLLHGLSLETNFSDQLFLTPSAEAASSGVMGFIPSVGAGVGVPVRLLPAATAGIRLQLSIQWPVVGFVTLLDLFPGLDPGDDGFFQVTLLGQVAL